MVGNLFSSYPRIESFGNGKHSEWKTASEYCRICSNGNIANLGGLNQGVTNNFVESRNNTSKKYLSLAYLNTKISNWFKVLVGFIPAFLFIYLHPGLVVFGIFRHIYLVWNYRYPKCNPDGACRQRIFKRHYDPLERSGKYKSIMRLSDVHWNFSPAAGSHGSCVAS